MAKLDDLIKELCPNGVEYNKLDEVMQYEQPSKYIVSNTDYSEKFETPVLTAGQTFILGYTNETSGIYEASKDAPVIIFDDFTTTNKWVAFKFKIKSSAMKLLTSKDDKKYNLRYLFHVMQTIKYVPVDHSRQWIAKYSQFKIPVPPMEVQSEIVRILDNFTELTAELTARKKQYEYYRDELLTFTFCDNIQHLTLGDIGKVSMCKRILKSETNTITGVPFYKIGTFGKEPDAYISEEMYLDYKSKFSFPNKGDILISASGTIGRTVVYDGSPAYYQDSNIVWLAHDESIVLNKYLYYYYQLKPWNVANGGTIARLYNDNIAKAKISVPPLEEQKRIVSILDRFDALCNDISIGLPAEIEARKKQYEYYRDKLLTFRHCCMC